MKKSLPSTSSDTDGETVTEFDGRPPFETSLRSDSYSDPDTEPDIGQDSDSEGEFLRQRIDYHEAKGRAKPRRNDWTNSLVKREFEHWQRQAPPSWAHKLDSFLLLIAAA